MNLMFTAEDTATTTIIKLYNEQSELLKTYVTDQSEEQFQAFLDDVIKTYDSPSSLSFIDLDAWDEEMPAAMQ
jgi:hypothetical protein